MTTLIHRLHGLTMRHRRLDDEIRNELQRPSPDSLRLLRLKWMRLAVKERLHRLFRCPALCDA